MSSIPAEAQAELAKSLLTNYEIIIRDFAGNVISLCQSRRDHPSYGVIKSQIAKAVHQMDGAIGAYMVLAGQANHPFLARCSDFIEQETTDRVFRAYVEARKLKVST